MATITAVPGGGTWATTTTWDTGTVPTTADDVILAATSGAVTIAAAAVCRSLNASAYTSTLTHNAAVTLSIGDATAGTGNAALTLGASMTYTLGNSATSAVTLVSTNATQQTITTAGKTLGNLTFNGVAGSWLFTDAVTCATLLISAGSLATGSQTITCAIYNLIGASAFTAIGTSTINMTSTGTVNLFVRSGGTFTAGAATLNVVNASANTRTFAPQATSFNLATLNYTVAGSTGALIITGTNTLATLNFSDASNGRTLTLTASATNTISTFNVQGSPAGVMTIQSSTAGTASTLTKPSRVVSCDYLSLKDVTATGGAIWYAGANSTVVSNVTGWILTAPTNTQFLQFAGVV